MEAQYEFHDTPVEQEATGSSSRRGHSSPEDIRHKEPFDRTEEICWIWEDTVNDGCVLTEDGVTQIVEHEYTPGSYTHLDNLCNPFWTMFTEWLPLSMAPNLVTLWGGSFCFLSYIMTWYYMPNFTSDDKVPDWLFALNGCTHVLYYTLDCMDGKQARRTKTSSPLGQLFDHGMDCLCNLSHLSAVHAFLQGGNSWIYPYTHLALQFVFFTAQWEEYYTGILPHSAGNWVGVTEVNYFTASLSILNAFIDRERLYSQTVQETMPSWIMSSLMLPSTTTTITNENSAMTQTLLQLQMRDLFAFGWLFLVFMLVSGSIVRVYAHIMKQQSTTTTTTNKTIICHPFVMAMSKLSMPALVAGHCLYLLHCCSITSQQIVLYHHIRYFSLSVGLLFCILTNKMIVFSMAKMAYATVQWDAIVFIIIYSWLSWEFRHHPVNDDDNNHTKSYGLTPLGLLCVWRLVVIGYVLRLLLWTRIAIGQIAKRLDIYVFTIKHKQQ